MSSRSDEGLCCPVCKEVFRNPVVLSCSHSFCKVCLHKWWKEKPTRECPICTRRSSRTDPPCNLVLKNLCEAFLLERDQRSSEDLCSLHAEKLKLFCLDHQEPVCLICRDSEMHIQHRFRPIDEAARQQKKNLQDTLQPLKEKMKVLKEVKVKFDQTLQHIKVQARLTESQIKEQFQKLYQFLQEEEEARLRALREEEEQKIQTMKKEVEALNKEIEALSNTVRDTEDQMMAKDILFLKYYKATGERVQQRPLLKVPQLPSGALIDQAKHLGNLGYNIWTKMKDLISYTPIILDPNTAHPEFILSDDLTSISDGPRQQLPDNPERFGESELVITSQGFICGEHSWNIEVGDSTGWTMGVLAESVPRKEDVVSDLTLKVKLWGVGFAHNEYGAFSPSALPKFFSLRRKPKRIRVHLDCDGGQLSFYDIDNYTQIHSFTPTFTEKVYPYFVSSCKLKILPQQVCVKLQDW